MTERSEPVQGTVPEKNSPRARDSEPVLEVPETISTLPEDSPLAKGAASDFESGQPTTADTVSTLADVTGPAPTEMLARTIADRNDTRPVMGENSAQAGPGPVSGEEFAQNSSAPAIGEQSATFQLVPSGIAATIPVVNGHDAADGWGQVAGYEILGVLGREGWASSTRPASPGSNGSSP
jgi:hypothetical protein